MSPSEAQEQKALIQWAQFNSSRYPELELLYHIPNGGLRNKREAAELKRLGVKAGVPDLCLPVARGLYHGLYIEMKRKGGQESKQQTEWLKRLKEQGYETITAYNFEQAADAIKKYLDKKKEAL